VRFGGDRPAWGSFQSHILNVLELLKAATARETHILKRMRLVGKAHIDVPMRAGRGVILATFHSGNWELAGLFLSLKGVPITTIAGEQLRPGWSDQVKALKERYGITMLGPDKPLRDLYRALEANEALVLHIDGDIFAGGHDVTFLGKRISAPRGPARLSRAMGAPVALAYCRRRPDNTLEVIVEPPMPPPRDESEEREMTQTLLSRVEKCIVDDPRQWCIFRRLS
jgi:KDO2-lipid IV(A) lauroyltransferase